MEGGRKGRKEGGREGGSTKVALAIERSPFHRYETTSSGPRCRNG
jgi:hypothetical protein